ncbi:MAG: hypothetical protein AAF552_01050 [Pseudomonadota bacterium]
MLYLAGQISASLLAAALLGAFVGWTLRGDLTQPARSVGEDRPSSD